MYISLAGGLSLKFIFNWGIFNFSYRSLRYEPLFDLLSIQFLHELRHALNHILPRKQISRLKPHPAPQLLKRPQTLPPNLPSLINLPLPPSNLLPRHNHAPQLRRQNQYINNPLDTFPPPTNFLPRNAPIRPRHHALLLLSNRVYGPKLALQIIQIHQRAQINNSAFRDVMPKPNNLHPPHPLQYRTLEQRGLDLP